MAISRDDLVIELTVDSAGVVRGLRVADDALNRSSSSARRADTAFQRLRTSISAAGATIVVLNQGLELARKAMRGFSVATKSTVGNFADFQFALVGVEKTTNATKEEMLDIAKGFTSLAETIPISTNALLDIAKAAGQLGVRGSKNLQNFAETIGRLGFATDLSGESAALALTRILNVTGTGIDQIDEFASVIVALGNNFAATESEIARTTTVIAQGIGQFGVAAEEAAALGTASRAMGIRFELAGSAITRTFVEMNRMIAEGGQELAFFSKFMGVAASDLKNKFGKDATGVFRDFLGKIKELKKEQIPLVLERFNIKGVESLRVIPPLAKGIATVDRAFALASKEIKNATALVDESQKAFDTLRGTTQLFKNTFVNTMTAVGAEFAVFAEQILRGSIQIIFSMRTLASQVNAALDAIDFEGLTVSVLKFGAAIAGAIALLKFGAILASVTATVGTLAFMAPLLKAAVIQATILAARFAFIAIKVTALVLGIEFIINNLSLVGDALGLVGRIIASVIVIPIRIILKIVDAILSNLRDMARSAAEMKIPGALKAWQLLNDQTEKGRDMLRDTDRVLDQTVEKAKRLVANFKKADFGIIAKGLEEANKGMDAFNRKGEESKESFANIGAEIEQMLKKLTALSEGRVIEVKINPFVQAGVDFEKQINDIMDFTKDFFSGPGLLKGIGEAFVEVFNIGKTIWVDGVLEPLGDAGVAIFEFARDDVLNPWIERLDKKWQEWAELFDDIGDGISGAFSAIGDLFTTEPNLGPFKDGLVIDEDSAKKASLIFGDGLEDAFAGLDFTPVSGAGANPGGIPESSILDDAGSAVADFASDFTGPLTEGLASAGGAVSAGASAALSAGAAMVPIAGQIIAAVSAATGIIKAIGGIPDLFADFLNAITDLPGMLATGFENFFQSILRLIRNLIPNIINMVTDILMSIADFVGELPDAMIDMVANIMDSIINLVNKLPEIIVKFVIGIIRLIVVMIPGMIKAFITALPELIKAIVNIIPLLIDGLIDGLKGIVNELANMFGFDDVFSGLGDKMQELKEDVAKVFTGAGEKLFSVTDINAKEKANSAAKAIQDTINKGMDDLTKLWRKLWSFITVNWKRLWNDLINIWRKLWKGLTEAWRNLWEFFVGMWRTIWGVFEDIIEGLGKAIGAVLGGIMDAIVAIIDNAIALVSNIVEILKQIAQFVGKMFEGIWNMFLSIGGKVGELLSNVWKGLEQAGQAVGAFFSKAWEGLKNAGKDLVESGKKFVKPIADFFGGVGEKIKSAFTGAFDGISFSGLTSSLKGMVEGVFGDLSFSGLTDKLKSAFNVDMGNLLSKAFTVNFKSPKGDIENILGMNFPWARFSSGGEVPGTGTGDTVPALLTPGEFVLTEAQWEAIRNATAKFTIPTPEEQAAKKVVNTTIDFPPLDLSGLSGLAGLGDLSAGNIAQQAGVGEMLGGAIANASTGKVVTDGGGDLFGGTLGDIIDQGEEALGKATTIPDTPQDFIDTTLGGAEDIINKAVSGLGDLWDQALREMTKGLKNGMSGMVRMNSGGLVPGSGGIDSVGARLTPGEFVMNRGAARSLGLGNLNAMNSGQSMGATTQIFNFDLKINVDSRGEKIDESFVRQRLMPTVKRELKSASQRGEFIMSEKGIRS